MLHRNWKVRREREVEGGEEGGREGRKRSSLVGEYGEKGEGKMGGGREVGRKKEDLVWGGGLQ
jgi:hypothetical protein